MEKLKFAQLSIFIRAPCFVLRAACSVLRASMNRTMRIDSFNFSSVLRAACTQKYELALKVNLGNSNYLITTYCIIHFMLKNYNHWGSGANIDGESGTGGGAKKASRTTSGNDSEGCADGKTYGRGKSASWSNSVVSRAHLKQPSTCSLLRPWTLDTKPVILECCNLSTQTAIKKWPPSRLRLRHAGRNVSIKQEPEIGEGAHRPPFVNWKFVILTIHFNGVFKL